MRWAEEKSPKEEGREIGGNPGEPWSVLEAGSTPLGRTQFLSYHMCMDEQTHAGAVRKLKPQTGANIPRVNQKSHPVSSTRWFSRFLDC